MELPQPTHKNYTTLISNIETGQIKIPQFQRDFVWTMERSAALLDSVVKGYPIGTFIFWRTKEHLRSLKELGGINLPTPKRNEPVVFVLDGQQRLTSLFAAMKGLKITHASNREEDFSNIYINLDATESEDIVTTEVDYPPGATFIRLKDLLYGSLRTLTEFPEKYHGKLDRYKRRIEAYDFPVIEVPDFPIDVATEIFTRINVGGKPLTVFEIMVAKTYDEKHKFDLSEEYSKLIRELRQFDYESITGQITLQLIALILKKDCKRQTILRLKKDAFIANWFKVVDSIKEAVTHLQRVIRVPVSHLLPYVSLVIPFAYFFYYHPQRPSRNQARELENFFWQCSLGDRYSSSVDSKLAQDIRRIDQILKDQSPKYDWEIDISPKHIIDNGWFNTGTSFIKAILCIMAYQRPLSFQDNRIVSIQNNWLKRSDSKNYHHYFPRSFLRKDGVDDSFANNVVNITIVDDYLNKREIGAKPPSKYMKKFQKDNSELVETMKTHLIGDLAKFGIWNDDYDTFIQKRAEIISKEIEKRIIAR